MTSSPNHVTEPSVEDIVTEWRDGYTDASDAMQHVTAAHMRERIENSHIIADLERELQAYRRATREAINHLADVPHAAKAGKMDVVIEFVDRALSALGGPSAVKTPKRG